MSEEATTPANQTETPSKAPNYLPTYLKNHKIKALIKANNRRCGPEFMKLLDKHVEALVTRACGVHNGGKKTLDATVAGFAGIV